jgi:predicted Zn-dependent protease
MHLIKSSDVNAFAIPGNHIIIYTGLIRHCDSVEELCGVLAHEMAHITLSHVTKRLVGELGISVLASVTTGDSRIANRVINLLSTTAFERKQEAEADKEGVKFLLRSHISANAFAGFMTKMSNDQPDLPEAMEWVSTHPDSKKRAETIRQLITGQSNDHQQVTDSTTWQRLKKAAE